jgi:hypothetical protein
MFNTDQHTAVCTCNHLLMRHARPRQHPNWQIIVTGQCLDCDCPHFTTPLPDRATQAAYADLYPETECQHSLIEIPSSSVRWISTPQYVRVGNELKTEPLPEGTQVMQCSACKAVFLRKPDEIPSIQ